MFSRVLRLSCRHSGPESNASPPQHTHIHTHIHTQDWDDGFRIPEEGRDYIWDPPQQPFPDSVSSRNFSRRFEYWEVEDEVLEKAGVIEEKEPEADPEWEEFIRGDPPMRVEEMMEEVNADLGMNLSFPFGPVPGDIGFGEPTPPEYMYLYREDEPADAPRMQGSPEDVAVVQGGNSRGGGDDEAELARELLSALNTSRDIRRASGGSPDAGAGGEGDGGVLDVDTVLQDRKELLDELALLTGVNKTVSLEQLRAAFDAEVRRQTEGVQDDLAGVGGRGDGGGQAGLLGAADSDKTGNSEQVDLESGVRGGLEAFSEEELLRELDRRRREGGAAG